MMDPVYPLIMQRNLMLKQHDNCKARLIQMEKDNPTQGKIDHELQKEFDSLSKQCLHLKQELSQLTEQKASTFLKLKRIEVQVKVAEQQANTIQRDIILLPQMEDNLACYEKELGSKT